MSHGSPIDGPEIGVTAPGTRVGTSRRVLTNTLLLAAGDLVSKLGLLVLYAVIARSLGKETFGDYTLVVSLAYFVRAATLGVDLILSREAARDPERVHGLFWEATVFKLGAGCAVLGGVVAFTAGRGYSGTVVWAVALIGASNLVDLVGLSAHAVLRGRELMGPPAKALALETTIVAAAGTILLVVFGAGLVALGVVYLVASFVALLYIGVAAARRGIRPRLRGSTRGVGWLARVAIPTAVASFLGAGLARLDAVILSAMTGDAGVVGLYGGAYRIFEATFFLNWALGAAVYPLLSRTRRQTRSLGSVFELSCAAICGLTFPFAGAMLFFGPLILTTLLGSSFAGGGEATRILAGATATYGLFTVAALTIVGQNRERVFAWVGGIALAVNVTLDVTLIPSFSLNGAAVAMTVAQTLATAITLWVALRETGRVSVGRALAAPLGGLAGMGAVALALGTGGAGLLVSIPAYAVCFLVVERLLYPGDLRLLLGAARLRPAAT